MKSWKTTLGGILASAGLLLMTSPDPTMIIVGKITAAIGAALTGMAARDNGVTSEQAGAKKW